MDKETYQRERDRMRENIGLARQCVIRASEALREIEALSKRANATFDTAQENLALVEKTCREWGWADLLEVQ